MRIATIIFNLEFPPLVYPVGSRNYQVNYVLSQISFVSFPVSTAYRNRQWFILPLHIIPIANIFLNSAPPPFPGIAMSNQRMDRASPPSIPSLWSGGSIRFFPIFAIDFAPAPHIIISNCGIISFLRLPIRIFHSFLRLGCFAEFFGDSVLLCRISIAHHACIS